MGTQWPHLLDRRGAARTQYSRLGGLPRLGGHRIEPARRKRQDKNAAARRRSPRRSHAADASPAIIRQRGSVASNPKALSQRGSGASTRPCRSEPSRSCCVITKIHPRAPNAVYDARSLEVPPNNVDEKRWSF